MMAPRTLAGTHSEWATAARIANRINDSFGNARIFNEDHSRNPTPPALTRPHTGLSVKLIPKGYIRRPITHIMTATTRSGSARAS